MNKDRERKRKRGTLYLILIGIAALILVVLLVSLGSTGATFISRFIRGTALLGYLALFLATLSSIYMRQMFQFFGRPFIKVHHTLSVSGLILVTLHPLGVAIASSSWRAFLPKFDSLTVFLKLGGRPAWYLIGAAALAAVWRKSIGQNWRWIHALNYVAFLLGTIHAIMIGTDFVSPVMRVIAGAMGAIVVGAFVQKRR
jgi:DMSO/TMAO reductase YedYZ heme-binding membrane subunit